MTNRNSSSDWIFDSGCSFHTSPNRSYFETFKELESGKVLMGNSSVCDVAGIGTIELKLHDGLVFFFFFLYNDRYITEQLKRNLISLGMLDDSGYK